MKKIELKILGAFDRFNYGDLLFPLMVKYGLDKCCSPDTFSYKYYSLAGGDYVSVGSIKSMNYKQLVRDIKRTRNAPNNVIVAGGECISASWDVLYGFISPAFFKLMQKRTFNKFLKKVKYSQRALGGVSDYPFCINKSDFRNTVRVLYNSVGGTHIETPCFPRLNNCDYLAVRENITSAGLSEKNIAHKVFPDSAILLSDMFPLSELRHNPELRDVVKKLITGKYIFFQISRYYHEEKLDAIAEQLDMLSKKNDFSIVLCPIGTAAGHEDHIPLSYLKGKLSGVSYFIDTPNVFEIMALIANARLYIGTSLHGAITSMSYAIPYIGLNPQIGKLKGYLSTWGHKELQQMADVNKFYENAESAIPVSRNELAENADFQKKLYYSSLSNMFNILTS